MRVLRPEPAAAHTRQALFKAGIVIVIDGYLLIWHHIQAVSRHPVNSIFAIELQPAFKLAIIQQARFFVKKISDIGG